MGKIKRFFVACTSLIMIIIGITIFLAPIDVSHVIAAILIGSAITILGLKNLIFYFTHAKNMVTGGKIFINSIILLDLGLLSFFVLLKSTFIASIYIAILFIIYGIVDILRVVDIYKRQGNRWIPILIKGIIVIALAILSIVFIKQEIVFTIIFGLIWIVLGIEKLITVFKKGSITYIQFIE